MNNPIAWLWLMLAIIGEVVATTSLKASKELTVLWPSVMIVIGYMFSFYFMILTMRHLPVSVTYAFWSAAGIIFITIAAALRFNEKPDLPAVLGIAMIVGGVLIITIFSKMKAS
ncbi:MAG: DMT family transporter [Candidatus Puniceispirillales bacterium]